MGGYGSTVSGYGSGGYGGAGGGPSSSPSTSTSRPTIIYRQLDVNNDPLEGQGQGDFLADRLAVAQAVLTRLRLFEGEWWESLAEGTPVWQQMLAVQGLTSQAAQRQVSLLLQQRILGTPFVIGVSQVQSTFDPQARTFSFYAVVQTAFGPVAISNAPQFPSQELPQ